MPKENIKAPTIFIITGLADTPISFFLREGISLQSPSALMFPLMQSNMITSKAISTAMIISAITINTVEDITPEYTDEP